MRDRMIAAGRQRSDACGDDTSKELFDIGVAAFEREAAAEWHIADVSDAQFAQRSAVENVIVGADAFDRA